MAGETQLTLIGNLVDDVDMRFTPSGVAVANFRVASTPRTFDRQAGEWKDGESMFLTCTVWRQYAENVAETLSKGMRVIVQGRLKQRSFETREGDKRTVFEIDVDEVGPALRRATAKVAKNPAQGAGYGGAGGGFGGGQPQGGGYGNQGGGYAGAPQNGPPGDDPWASPNGPGAGFTNEPPF